MEWKIMKMQNFLRNINRTRYELYFEIHVTRQMPTEMGIRLGHFGWSPFFGVKKYQHNFSVVEWPQMIAKCKTIDHHFQAVADVIAGWHVLLLAFSLLRLDYATLLFPIYLTASLIPHVTHNNFGNLNVRN